MNTTAVLTYRLKGNTEVYVARYNFADADARWCYEEHVDSHRAIKDDAGNYIQESMVDYMVTSFEMK
jgi:hypothetical protein